MDTLALDPHTVRRLFLKDLVAAYNDMSTAVAASSNNTDDFRQNYNKLANASSKTRARIFEDPRMAILLTSAESEIHNAIDDTLPDSFVTDWVQTSKLVAISVAVLDQSPHSVDSIHLVAGPNFLIGTNHYFWSEGASGENAIVVQSNGLVRLNGCPVRLLKLPESRGLVFTADDHTLQAPHFAKLTPLSGAQVVNDAWLKVISDAVDLIALHDESVELVRLFARAIVPVQGTVDNVHCSVSFSTRPGALFFSFAPDPKIIAEAIVHEADHQWFYVLTRYHSFWAQSLSDQPEIFRSPWRDDPRPLDGLLRGASAFIRVAAFWASIACNTGISIPAKTTAGQKAILAVVQALDALQLIDRFGELTSSGGKLVAYLGVCAAMTAQNLSGLSDFSDLYEAAKKEMAAHDEAWCKRNRAIDKDRVTI